ncbi:YqeG family HAD IIIA-type phosphatase [Enterococcus nangangensis]|uniref:YqeG family HAD IIIA-type phosphatase n=1 Tax=Enterococcus nangangensis TaxID=2559926 RepID=UPI001BB28232|nr:YqeG family HAD IIIA-type phosphatase [Enterococcus nangangensis]
MFQSFRPTWTVEALYALDIKDLHQQNIQGILVDLDNTLVAWNNPDGTPELRKWIKEMRAFDIPVMVVSNNKASRIDRVVTHLGLSYVARALKPFTRGLHEAQKKLGIPKENLVMVGDQLMTDIKAANSFGIRSILVRPLVTSDAWNTKFNRAMEKVVKNKLFPTGIRWERKLT